MSLSRYFFKTFPPRWINNRSSLLWLISPCVTHPLLWQRGDDDEGEGDHEVSSEQLELAVPSPQSVGSCRRTSLWDSFSRPAHRTVVIKITWTLNLVKAIPYLLLLPTNNVWFTELWDRTYGQIMWQRNNEILIFSQYREKNDIIQICCG